jgi:anti-sigma B factor antagonist
MREPVTTSHGGVATPLQVTWSDVARDVLLCSLLGEVDLATGARLEKELTDAITRTSCHLIVDLAEVEFFGSIGMKILIDTSDRQDKTRRHVAVVVGDNQKVERPLRAIGLDQILDIHHELATAVTACRTSPSENLQH